MFHHASYEPGSWRWWLHYGGNRSISLEVSWGRISCAVGMEANDEGIMFQFAPALFAMYLTFNTRLSRAIAKRILPDYEGRRIGIRVFDWALWWDGWAPTMSWNSKDPWWLHFSWHPLDTFFGRMKYESTELSRTETVIPMPEKSYPCVVVMTADTWKRPRLPWYSHKITRAKIDCKEGVPFPGKGENAWDCDDDASHGLTCPAKTVEQGIAAFVESVLRSRRRYGGSVNWKQAA